MVVPHELVEAAADPTPEVLDMEPPCGDDADATGCMKAEVGLDRVLVRLDVILADFDWPAAAGAHENPRHPLGHSDSMYPIRGSGPLPGRAAMR